jgi:hypothetical protein
MNDSAILTPEERAALDELRRRDQDLAAGGNVQSPSATTLRLALEAQKKLTAVHRTTGSRGEDGQ